MAAQRAAGDHEPAKNEKKNGDDILRFYIVAAIAGILVVLTLLPLSRHDAWWVRGLDFPRLQIALALAVTAAAEVVLLDFSNTSAWILLAVTLAALLYQASWIVPHTKFFPREVKPSVTADTPNTIRLMNANVLMPNRASDALLRIVRDNEPDILVTLETDQWWEQKLSVLEGAYPHTLKCPLDNLYGMHVYSKFPLRDSAIQYLVEPDVPSIHTLVVLPSGQEVRIHFLHPAPPSPTENETSSERDAELLLVGKSAARSRLPVIVAGDLNDVAWSETTTLFRKVSGLLDPRIGRGMFNTFNSRHWYFRWPLDHVFHSRHFTVSRIVRLPDFGSDHFPLMSELVYEKGLVPDHAGPDASSEDQRLAEQKIDERSHGLVEVHRPGEQGG